MTEAELRDKLASDISVLGEGLTLLEKEHYIPNALGTRSFVDLYAKNEEGHHVLIELKRSNAAAREAIHEIYKYIEGVKAHLGARDNELLVLLASTEWRELLVPFSRFLADTDVSVRGIQLSVEDSGRLVATPAPTVPVSKGRFIAPWHEVLWYLTKDSMNCGVATIQKSFDRKGITDYVVALLKAAAPISSEHQAGVVATIRQIGQMRGSPMAFPAPPLPKYEWVAYVGIQMLSADQCVQLLKSNPEAYEESSESRGDESEEERLFRLHEALLAMEPRPESDYLEIGYPAKLSKFVEAQNLNIERLVRHGVFARNSLLTDDAIIAELRAEDGSTGQRFKRTVSVENPAHIATARREIVSCLEENTVWQSHILRALSEIEREYSSAEVDISIYNPQTGLFTIYLTTTRQDGPLFMPTYTLLVRNPGPVRLYYGALQSAGRAGTFGTILKKYYHDDLGQLLITMTWGGRENRDADVLEDAGAVYRSFRCDIDAGEAQRFFALRDERWREVERVDPFSLWADYLHQNETFVRELVEKIAACDHGDHYEMVNAGLLGEQSTGHAMGRAQRLNCLSVAPNHCSTCGCSFDRETYTVQVRARKEEMVESLCIDCFAGKHAGILLYAIDRADIESGTTTHIEEFFKRISETDFVCRNLQGRVEVSVSGYDDDKRELWEIEEVRRWYEKSDSKVKHWFFFCNTTPPAHGLKNYFACLSGTRWLKEKTGIPAEANVEMSPALLETVFDRNWSHLNEITQKLGMSLEENKRISSQIMDLMRVPHGA